MVELDIVQDRRVRKVVHELGTLVEVGGVVFVALDHERGSIRPSIARSEVLGDSSNQETRRESGAIEDPRHQRGRSRLAVRPGDDDRMATADELVAQHGGGRRVWNARIEDVLDLGIPARNGIPDDDDVRSWVQVLRPESRRDGNALLSQHRRHRRIHVVVRAADVVSLRAKQSGETGHRRATDPNQVIVHAERDSRLSSEAA